MSFLSQVREEHNRLTVLIIFAFAIFFVSGMIGLLVLTAAPAEAGRKGNSCNGTYLMDFGTSTDDPRYLALWTFTEDGIFLGTDSSQDNVTFGFSHQQGTWQAIGKEVSRKTSFDFDTDGLNGTTSMVRSDSIQTFSDNCATISAEFDLRAYEVASGAQDPFDINDGAFLFSGSATGRLVTTD